MVARMVLLKNFQKTLFLKILEQKIKFEKRGGIGRTEMIVIDENGNATAFADSRGGMILLP